MMRIVLIQQISKRKRSLMLNLKRNRRWQVRYLRLRPTLASLRNQMMKRSITASPLQVIAKTVKKEDLIRINKSNL